MAITKVTNNGVADNAITSDKISDGSISNNDLGATLDLSSKTVTLPSASVTAHATNPTKASIETLGIDVPATDLTGTIPDARFPATLPAIDGSNLTGISTVTDFASLTDATVSTSDPTTNTNPSATGHIWVNKTSGEVYVCTDNTTDDNIWVNVGEGTDNVAIITWYGDRGVFAGQGSNSTNINYISISTLGNFQDFGDLTVGKSKYPVGVSDGSRGVFAGGADDETTIDYITISTLGNATDFGDMTQARQYASSCSDGIKGIFAGGYSDTFVDVIEYITIDTPSNATDFGDLSHGRYGGAGCGDGTRGFICGGYGVGGGWTISDTIDYITVASSSNASDFGDLTIGRINMGATSGGSRGIVGGGEYSSALSSIDYFNMSSAGNASDFGDLLHALWGQTATSDNSRAVFAGFVGQNYIEYITIDTLGNATDFGNTSSTSDYLMGSTSGD